MRPLAYLISLSALVSAACGEQPQWNADSTLDMGAYPVPPAEMGDSTDAHRLMVRALALAAAGGDTVNVESDSMIVRVGRLFDPDRRHVYIRLFRGNSPMRLELERMRVYDLHPRSRMAEPLIALNLQLYAAETLGDTLLDVNGDGYDDLVSMQPASSGCCPGRKDVIFLFDPQHDRFRRGGALMNPVYYADGIVRGLEYGHPSEVPVYETRFDGFRATVTECIYPIPGTTRGIVPRHSPRRDARVDRRVLRRDSCDTHLPADTLSDLPARYDTATVMGWFVDY